MILLIFLQILSMLNPIREKSWIVKFLSCTMTKIEGEPSQWLILVVFSLAFALPKQNPLAFSPM